MLKGYCCVNFTTCNFRSGTWFFTEKKLDGEHSFTYTSYIHINKTGPMNKKTLFKEIEKELNTLNDRIDTKIIKGRSYVKEARRHKALLKTMELMGNDTENRVLPKRRSLLGRSPVRRRLERGVASRIFPWNFA